MNNRITKPYAIYCRPNNSESQKSNMLWLYPDTTIINDDEKLGLRNEIVKIGQMKPF